MMNDETSADELDGFDRAIQRQHLINNYVIALAHRSTDQSPAVARAYYDAENALLAHESVVP